MTTTCSHRIGTKGSKSCADCGVRLRGAALTEARMSRAIAESTEAQARLKDRRDAEDDEIDRADQLRKRLTNTSAIEARFSDPSAPRRRVTRPRKGFVAGLLSSLALSLGSPPLARK